MLILKKSILFILIALLLLSCSSDDKIVCESVADSFLIKDKAGKIRHFSLYYPCRGVNSKTKLLVYFHGVLSDEFKDIPSLKDYTGSPVGETELINYCRGNNFLLLVPKPSYSFKFLNCNAHGWSPFDKETDGVEKLIDKVALQYKVNSKDIYLAGISAGAVFAHHLANKRPQSYGAVLSHSQAYTDENSQLLTPAKDGKFVVLFAYTKGDYANLKELCEKSFKLYEDSGYKTGIIRDLPPLNHSWSFSSNRLFLRAIDNLQEKK